MEAADVILGQWQGSGLSAKEVAEKFSQCILYVTCEPCIMCASALSILGISIEHAETKATLSFLLFLLKNPSFSRYKGGILRLSK